MINAQWNQRIDNVESSLSQKLDELQNDMFQKLNNLEDSISRLTNQQHVHSKEENAEEVHLSDTMVEEHCTLLTEEGNGKEAGEDHQRLTLQPIPINLDPNAIAKPKNNPLSVYTLPAVQFTPEALAPKAHASHHCLCKTSGS